MRLEVTTAAAQAAEQKWPRESYLRLRPNGDKKHGPKQELTPTKKPGRVVAVKKVGSLTFYISYDDEWFFSGLLTTLDYQPGQGFVFSFADSQGHNPDSVSGASSQYEWMWY